MSKVKKISDQIDEACRKQPLGSLPHRIRMNQGTFDKFHDCVLDEFDTDITKWPTNDDEVPLPEGVSGSIWGIDLIVEDSLADGEMDIDFRYDFEASGI